MPIFRYKCLKCNTEFDFIAVKSIDEPKCPKCQEKKELTKILTSANFRFKEGTQFKSQLEH